MKTKFNNLVDRALLERTAPELAAGFVRGVRVCPEGETRGEDGKTMKSKTSK